MKNSKIVTIIFLSAGAIMWFLSQHYVTQWAGYFQLPRRIGPEGADIVRYALPILVGALTFILLKKNTKASFFVSDCVDELFRVVFPGPKETRMGTIWVITLVIMAGILFGVLDLGITSVIRTLIGLKS